MALRPPRPRCLIGRVAVGVWRAGYRMTMLFSAETMPARLFWTVTVFVIAAFVLFGRAVASDVNVDENVYIAGAALLKQGQLPYRDFHYNHLPTMVLLYAGLFYLTDHLLLAARCCSAACGAVVVVVVFRVALGALASFGPRKALGLAIGAAALLLLNPVFIYASGYAWNHAFPMMLCLLAFVAMRRGLSGDALSGVGPSAVMLGLSGVAMGLAVTSRLTFAPALLGFLLFGVLMPGWTVRQKAALACVFTLGFAAALVPSGWVWAQSPANAYFGNFQYPALNTKYHYDTNYVGRFTFNVPQKLLFVLKRFIRYPAYGVAAAAFFVLLYRTLRWREIARDRGQCVVFAAAAIATLLLAGGLVPSPLFRQYLSANLPFLVVTPALCLACRPDLLTIRFGRVLAGGLLLAVVFGVRHLDGVATVPFADRWVPVRVHQAGVRLTRSVNADAGVLTTAPVYVFEGGGQILTEMTTGRFGLRAAEYLTADQKAQYLMGDSDDMVRTFKGQHPPAAVLIAGFDAEADPLFRQAAVDHGYRHVDLPGKLDLWVRPP